MKAPLQAATEWLRAWNRRRLRHRQRDRGPPYEDWVAAHDTLTPGLRAAIESRTRALPDPPVISVLMPVYDPDPAWLDEAIRSVEAQLYPHWQLCIADDASTKPAVHEVLRAAASRDGRISLCFRPANGHIVAASNSALDAATGAWVALLDHDDLLPAHALALLAETAVHFPQAAVIYTDEDVIDAQGRRRWPWFKPDWNPELFRAHNAVCHLGAYRTALVREVGGFRPGFEGAQDYDLAARCIDAAGDAAVVHIPHVLYHWRIHAGSSAAGLEVKPYIQAAGVRALVEHLQRRHAGEVQVVPGPAGGYRVRHAEPVPLPAVRVLVAAGVNANALRAGTDHPGARWSAFDEALHDEPLVCIVHASLTTGMAGWLRTLATLAARPGTGAVAPRLLRADGQLAAAGLVLGGDAGLALLHEGLAADDPGYRGRAVLSQNFTALPPGCLVLTRAAFEAAGGPALLQDDPWTATITLCLRLRERRLAHMLAADVDLTCTSGLPAMPSGLAALVARLSPGTAPNDPAYNPNLAVEGGRFQLAAPPAVSLATPWWTAPPRDA